MSVDLNEDARLPRMRRLITAAIAADIATHMSKNNTKRDEFTSGQLLIQAEAIETLWLKNCSKLEMYANQSKLFKSSMYKIKVGSFLREYAPVDNNEKKAWDGIKCDINEIKKQIKALSGKKKHN